MGFSKAKDKRLLDKSEQAPAAGQITLTAVTVSPALVLPMPVVSTERGMSLEENLRNWDLAVPVEIHILM